MGYNSHIICIYMYGKKLKAIKFRMKGCRKMYGLFIEKIEQKLKAAEKSALIFIDVDNFKYVNYTYGHKFGDRLLERFYEILTGLLNDNCTIYRIGGDKFAVLVERFETIQEIEKLAITLLKGLKLVRLDGRVFYYTVSIGISFYPEHGSTVDDLCKSADIAFEKAKETGKNKIVIYSDSMILEVQEWVLIESYLRNALENNEFELYFQPIYETQNGRISGFETLVRWRNDEMGFVMPDKFIEVAEDTHMIISIGEWIFRNACMFQKNLQQEGYKDIVVSVNVSRLQLLQEDFVEVVMDMLEMVGISPDSMEIEVAEPILAEARDLISDKLKTLNGNGLRITMDGFGKGYSSMNFLKQLPITSLKIDKSIVDTINGKQGSVSLVDYMVHVAKSIDLNVLAEGIETREQYDYMQNIRCDRLQGYFLSRPLSERDAIGKLQHKGDEDQA